ncbi:MAG: TM1802 family CRISPR-associated protein [Flavobacteriales bacterium]|nr:TM1802 family CRISPR-associated protein [Flavobacteriales bacterium]
MLATLSKIGEQLLEGKGIWARLTTEPKYNPDKKNWVCPILFDCINKEIRVLKDEMELFRPDESAIKFRHVKATRKGPRQSKFDLTVEGDDLKNLHESLFGKGKKPPGCMSSIESSLPEALDSPFYKNLHLIQEKLRQYSSSLAQENIKEELGEIFREVALFTAKIRTQANEPPFFLFEQDEFLELTKRVFKRENPKSGLSHLTGNKIEDAVEAQFWSRYNIHKIFQMSSYNYAANFNQNNFHQNFQGSDDDLDKLDRASSYVLKNLKTNIAGISHIIIPHFRNRDLDEFDLEETELYLNKSSDLLFDYNELDETIDRNLSDIGLFWINYIAFESDGNSFKIINHIRDVNSAYLTKLIETFVDVEWAFKDYIGGKFPYNLRSIYNVIPARDGNKSKVNPALTLFKDILEQKQISQENLFKHFIELTLCHWYGRHAAFSNVRKIDSFDFAIKDAVFKYSALIYTLKQLNLLEMEKATNTDTDEHDISTSEFEQRIQTFFSKMEYSEAEKALFYLGRIINSVARAQYDKLHKSKPVLNKIKFNGMDSQAIMRLSLELREKSRQYNIHKFTDWDFGRFTDRFNEKNWPLSKEQNVFYLMAGYSFGLTKTDNNQ